MNNYTEHAEEVAYAKEHSIPLHVQEMLRDYAALLREREKPQEKLRELAQAAVDYDAAIEGCVNTILGSDNDAYQGDNLDTMNRLYTRWISLAREALKELSNGRI